MAAEVQRSEAVIQNGDVDMPEVPSEVLGPNDLEAMKGLDDSGKPIRLIRKAKRFHRNNSGEATTNANTNNNSTSTAPLPLAKNSRKSRDGRGKGDPKKGKQLIANLIRICFIACILLLVIISST